MHLIISQPDPHALQAADIILISRVGLGDVCRAGEISVLERCILEQVPAEGPQGSLVDGGPSAEVQRLSHCAHCRDTQETETVTQPAFIATAGLHG